jgi:hypothetical protein
VDVDGALNITDPVALLSYLFLGLGEVLCEKSADTDDTGRLDLSDSILTLNFLFLGGPPPSEPFAACGQDSTEDTLTCTSFPPCGG